MRTLKGLVTSAGMDKTIVVSVHRYESHSKYKKSYRLTSKFYAHDEKNVSKVGDTVTISETKPTSKTKRWVLVESAK